MYQVHNVRRFNLSICSQGVEDQMQFVDQLLIGFGLISFHISETRGLLLAPGDETLNARWEQSDFSLDHRHHIFEDDFLDSVFFLA